MLMTLGDAIRLGALLKPQGVGQYGSARSCALRAAADALGLAPTAEAAWRGHAREGIDYNGLIRHFPILDLTVPGPPGLPDADRLLYLIWRLNDSFGWTRERIADWIDALPISAPPQAAEQELTHA